MWLNIASGVAAAAGLVVAYLPLLEVAIPAKAYGITLFIVSILNVGLRKITDTSIE
ncbi:hypothetical protein LCGC14_2809880 [marine sediment metagenome]|uniref:Uncharacterized protein n=1 Tax=marine sediment metagenome TaxID=412755 RepID=A0A0F8Z711_9ZZZZ